MDTKSLEAFRAVYELGSLSNAASRLYISQQGLSRTVGKLEAEMGVPLFERTPRGMVPTDYGRVLYSRTLKITALLDSLADDVASLAERRKVQVGAVTGFFQYVGLGFVDDYERNFPDIALSVDEDSDRRIIQMLENEEVAVAFLAGPVDLGRFDAIPFSRHRHVLVVPEGDGLAGRETVSFADLEGRVVALLGPSFSPYANNVRRLEAAGAHPERLVEVAEGNTGTRLAQQGKAVFISTDYSNDPVPTGTAVVPFDDPAASWDIFLVTKRGRSLDEDEASFRDWALAWIDAHRKDLFRWKWSV